MARLYLLFHSTHETLKAESLLRDAGLSCRVVQKPAAIRVDCGLAVRALPEDRDRALETLDRSGIRPRGVFTV
ncbi:hypothetical protein J2Z79_002237 [Symbiobacterium terraclitae]|jgi:hypothetical protein|uniref:Putative Se/S carrier protein-like domain-containing protein n=2 Tax=Symbiobacterium terraclitae TaxID=557451 RepID=A0ABS4JTF7_9FIRM|nr:DUF3343 domain-containing protein [Symbiobacterium terraclitae]MBP2018822.1 hypothetical protein [Symbiobacterium terraclitae]